MPLRWRRPDGWLLEAVMPTARSWPPGCFAGASAPTSSARRWNWKSSTPAVEAQPAGGRGLVSLRTWDRRTAFLAGESDGRVKWLHQAMGTRYDTCHISARQWRMDKYT